MERGFEDVGRVHFEQRVADAVDVRVLRRVGGAVGALPAVGLMRLGLGVEAVKGGLTARPEQGEVGHDPVQQGRFGRIESGVAQGTDHRVRRMHLGGSSGGAGPGERRGCGVREVGAAHPSAHICEGVGPVRLGREALEGFFEQPVRDREQDVVLAGEVAVDRGLVGAERLAEARHGEAVGAVFVEEFEARLHDAFRGECAPGQAGATGCAGGAAGCGGHRFIISLHEVLCHGWRTSGYITLDKALVQGIDMKESRVFPQTHQPDKTLPNPIRPSHGTGRTA